MNSISLKAALSGVLMLSATVGAAQAQVPPAPAASEATAPSAPATAPAAGGALTGPQVKQLLGEKGFTKVHDVKFKEGLWKAQARSGDGRSLKLLVDPASGRIYGEQKTSRLSETDVRAAVSAAGYSDAHDIEFEDGLWKAQAEHVSGKDVELRVDPNDGHVLGVQND